MHSGNSTWGFIVAAALAGAAALTSASGANDGVEPAGKPPEAVATPPAGPTLAELARRIEFLEKNTRSVYCGSADIDAGTPEVVHFDADPSTQSVILVMYGEAFSSFHYTELPYHVHRLPPLPHSHGAGTLLAEPDGAHTHAIGVPGFNEAQLQEDAVYNTRVRRSPRAVNRNIVEPAGKHGHLVSGFTGDADPGKWFDEALARYMASGDASAVPYIRPFCTGASPGDEFDPLIDEVPRKEGLSRMEVLVDGNDFASWYRVRTGEAVDLSGSLGALRGRKINITSLLSGGSEHTIEFRQPGEAGGKIRYRVEVLNRLLPEEAVPEKKPARPSVEPKHKLVPAEEVKPGTPPAQPVEPAKELEPAEEGPGE